MIIEIPPGKSSRRDDESTRTLANVGEGVLTLAAQRTALALIRKLGHFWIDAESWNLAGRKGREHHRRHFSRRECDRACECVARFCHARLWPPDFRRLQLSRAN